MEKDELYKTIAIQNEIIDQQKRTIKHHIKNFNSMQKILNGYKELIQELREQISQ